MTDQDRQASGSKPRRALLATALLAASLLFSCGLAELVLRARGDRPFSPDDVDIRVEPGGKYQSGDPVLGYRHLPGEFEITFPDGHSWNATHTADTLRITRPLESYATERHAPEIWIFGCSFVHGWGLDDAETFPWKLQQALPDYSVRNFGVGGYSTLQSLLQFRQALESDPEPAVAVLAYAGFHDVRNARLRIWRKATLGYSKFGTTAQPYARLNRNDELEFRFDDGSYRDLFFSRHLALAARLDAAYTRAEDRYRQSHRVSRRLVTRFAQTAQENGIPFVLAGIRRSPRTSAMFAYTRNHAIPTLDLTIDLQQPGMSIAFDGHPSGRATTRYAEKLLDYLRESDLLTE